MSLRKVRLVAVSEFGLLIRTRVFLLSLVLVPVFSLALGDLQHRWTVHPDGRVRRFAVLDSTDVLYPAIEKAALEGAGARYQPVRLMASGPRQGRLRQLALEQVRRGELFAYIEIPKNVLQGSAPDGPALRYYSDTPTYDGLSLWLAGVLGQEIRRRRILSLDLDPTAVAAADQGVPVLCYAVAGGSGDLWAPVDVARALVPVGSMLLLFLMVMLTAPQMMSSIIEEKMSRISEVLLASVSAFDLMLGKLLACCGASVLVGLVYAAGGLALAAHFGYVGLISAGSLAGFVVFLVLAVFLNGSLYMAVGAACGQPKDAQGLLGPLVLLTSLPLFALGPLMQDPSGAIARSLSFFPLSAPFVMCFRMNSQPAPTPADLAGSILVTLMATLACVWAASRVLRVGLLVQGRNPGLTQLWRWIFLS